MEKNARQIFAKNLNYYMERTGVTQADIARRTHAQTSTVSYWCTGRSYPRPGMMQAIADMLSVSMSDLMDEHPANEEESKADTNSEFFKYALDLNEEGYKVLLPIMKVLASSPEYQRRKDTP